MKTQTATIRAISSVPIAHRQLGLTISILLDTKLVLRVRPQTLKQWGDKMRVGTPIAYDVDEQGCLSNPRPALCLCGDDPAHCQRARCLVDAP